MNFDFKEFCYGIQTLFCYLGVFLMAILGGFFITIYYLVLLLILSMPSLAFIALLYIIWLLLDKLIIIGG
jgi:hypothetical protein